MKIYFFVIALFSSLMLQSSEQILGGWTEIGEFEYNYDYARTYLGHQMRKDGWTCKIGFTAGAKREQEHSVWEKNGRKMQVMIWRIDTGKTGYSKGEITAGKQNKGKKNK